jgi:hypothetical protein
MSKKNKDDYVQNQDLLNAYIKKGEYRFLVDNML